MALSDDRAALLRLLLGGDTYERVAELLGVSPDEVRGRAHEAAAALRREPSEEFSADQVEARLAFLEGAAPDTPAPAARPAGRRRWALWAAGGGALAVIAVVATLVAGGGDGGDGGGSASAPDREDVVPVRMSPVGGSGATGTIAVARAGDQPAVDLALRGLRPSGPGESYVLWFVGSGNRSLPVAFQAVGRDGRLTGRSAIPTAAAGLLPSFDSAELTLTGQRAAGAAVQRAAAAGTLPQPVGTPVLRGKLR
jgi:hypothetical protein